MTHIKGNLYQPNSADCEQVSVTVHGAQLIVRDKDGGEQLTLPLQQIKLSSGGFDGKRVFVEDTASGITIMAEPGLLKEIEKQNKSGEGKQLVRSARASIAKHGATERKHWMIFLTISIALGVGIWQSVDAFVTFACDHIPPAVEEKFGNYIFEDYKKEHKLDDTSADAKRVQAIVNRLESKLSKHDYKYHVYIENTKEVNAFAVPGGNVVVLKGLLNQSKNDSEIAGVVGHEIGHVVGRHSLRAALHKAGLFMCLSVIAGKGDDAMEWLARLINLESLGFSRTQEAQADHTGVDLAYKAGYDPHGLLNFFERVQKEHSATDSKLFEILSNHPCTPDRIKAVQAEIDDLNAQAKLHPELLPQPAPTPAPPPPAPAANAKQKKHSHKHR